MIRTQMDKGPAKTRRRGTANVRPGSCQLACTEAQTETLDQFFVTTLKGGTLSFNWVHPRTQAAAERRFVTEPVYRDLGGDRWVADIRFEVLP